MNKKVRTPADYFRIVFACILLCYFSANSLAQNSPPSLPPLSGEPQSKEEGAWEAQQKQAALKKINQKRDEEIKQDTTRLLELATELKQYVDKTNENMLSVDVIRKAEQIEKLAHTVKDKMKGP
jgi:type VI protein secretion system component VasF